MRETWRDGRAFFFGFAEEEWEFLDCGHRNISTVVAGQKGLMLSVRSHEDSMVTARKEYLALQV